MAAFRAKHIFQSVKEKMSGAHGDKEETKPKGEERRVDQEILEARRKLEEEKRKEKHRLQKEKREELRQFIRDKYGLKKKDSVVEEQLMTGGREDSNRPTNKKPLELAADNHNDEDEIKLFPFSTSVNELQCKESDLPAKISHSVGHKTQKCVVQ